MDQRWILLKKFKKWVTSEVLPSIRKTGSYSITPKDYPSALRALADEIDAKNRAIAERAQAEAERQQAIKTIEEQRPDVEFAESFKKVDRDLLAANNIKKFGLEKQNLLTQENINKTPVVNWEGDVELSAVAGAVKRQNVLV